MPLSGPMLECLEEAQQAGYMHPRQCGTFIFPSTVGCMEHCKERRHKLSHWCGDLRQTWVNASKEVGLDGYRARRLLDHSAGDAHDGYATEGKPGAHLFEAQEKVSQYLVAGLEKT